MSPCLRLELDEDERVRLLLEDYAFFVHDPDLFCQRLAALTELRGKGQVEAWQAQVRSGDVESVVRELLVRHYDPGYASSTARNFKRWSEAMEIRPRDRSPTAMRALARQILAQPPQPAGHSTASR